MPQRFVILLSTGDTVTRFADDGLFPTPGAGEDFDDLAPVDREPGVDEYFDWTARAILGSKVKARFRLEESVRAELERRQGVALLLAGARVTSLARRVQEVEAWYALGSTTATVNTLVTAFNALPLVTRQRRFRYAIASAAIRSEANIALAIARFQAADDAVLTKFAQLEAVADKVIQDMKAVDSPAAKQAVFDAANWGVAS